MPVPQEHAVLVLGLLRRSLREQHRGGKKKKKALKCVAVTQYSVPIGENRLRLRRITEEGSGAESLC